MKPAALDAYQWPPSTDVIADASASTRDAIVRFDGNVAAAPPPSPDPRRSRARSRTSTSTTAVATCRCAKRSLATTTSALDQVALGAGSDEFIVLLARLFAEGGTIATVPAYSYSMYRYAALMAGATLVEDPTQRRPRLRLSAQQSDRRAAATFPTSTGQLVIDEAYADYAGVDALDRLDEGAIILRTFSKAFGLAGARVGYALATPETRSR